MSHNFMSPDPRARSVSAPTLRLTPSLHAGHQQDDSQSDIQEIQADSQPEGEPGAESQKDAVDNSPSDSERPLFGFQPIPPMSSQDAMGVPIPVPSESLAPGTPGTPVRGGHGAVEDAASTAASAPVLDQIHTTLQSSAQVQLKILAELKAIRQGMDRSRSPARR